MSNLQDSCNDEYFPLLQGEGEERSGACGASCGDGEGRRGEEIGGV